MARKIQHKRGLEANLPQLDVAEIAFTTDSKKPFIGSADGNVEIAKKADVDAKASKTELTNAVSPKADKTYVDTELGKKASTEEVSAVSAQLAETAKKTYSKETKEIRPLVTFYLDDGYQNDYTIVYPKAKELGIPITVCLHNGSWLTQNRSALDELVSDGWEVHAHTVIDQDLRELTYEQQLQTMKENKDYLESLGYDIEGLCYPRGYANADTLKATRELFKVGMSSNQGTNDTPIDTYYVGRILTDSYDMAAMKALVDKIKEDGRGWIVFYSHSNIFHLEPERRDRFFEMMDYVSTSGVETATVREAMEVYENTLDIGDERFSPAFIKIGADGRTDMTGIPIIYDRNNTGINSRLGTSFKHKRITVNSFSSGSPSDIPFDSGVGTLITDRMFETDQNSTLVARQTFHGQKGKSVTRYFASGKWSDWEDVGKLNMTKTKNYTNDTPITDFPNGKLTKVTFIQTDASGFPDGGIGTLEVNRISGNDTLNYQMYYPYNKDYFYKRRWTSGGWGAWVKYSSTVTHSETVDFGTVTAGSFVTKSITIPGVTLNDVATVNFTYGLANGVVPFAYISGADAVVVKLINVTSADVAVGSRPIRLVVNKG